MPPKRAPKTPPAPTRSPAKKAPRPAATKKKQAPLRPAARTKESQPKVQKPKAAPKKVSQQLANLLFDPSASAQSVVDFVVGPTCGLESRHNFTFANMTPFLLAVYANRLDVAQLLVARHSVNTKAVAARNTTALHFASIMGYLEMVRWLVEQCGVDVHAVTIDGASSLQCAIMHKHSDAALLLLELGLDPNHPDNYKSTPLHYACFCKLVDVARALMAKGVDVNVIDCHGQSPLHLAINNGSIDVALQLLKLGADPNHSDNQGSIPLHLVCVQGLVDVARALIAKGASPASVNAQGKTPLDIALQRKNREMAALLEARSYSDKRPIVNN